MYKFDTINSFLPCWSLIWLIILQMQLSTVEKQICIFAILQIHTWNKKQGHQPWLGRNGDIDNQNKITTTDVGILFSCIFPCCTENKTIFIIYIHIDDMHSSSIRSIINRSISNDHYISWPWALHVTLCVFGKRFIYLLH